MTHLLPVVSTLSRFACLLRAGCCWSPRLFRAVVGWGGGCEDSSLWRRIRSSFPLCRAANMCGLWALAAVAPERADEDDDASSWHEERSRRNEGSSLAADSDESDSLDLAESDVLLLWVRWSDRTAATAADAS